MQHDDVVYLRHMLDTIDQITGLIDRRSKAQFDSDLAVRLAIAHLIQVLGEAASHVGGEIRSSHPDIPWTSIIGMRHRIVHDYFEIDFDTVWDVATVHTPPLRRQLEGILDSKG